MQVRPSVATDRAVGVDSDLLLELDNGLPGIRSEEAIGVDS
jgi:hypothetical protein